MNSTRPVGALLREWRQRRRLTQLDLAGLTDTSTRHISFLETGRSLPSRALLLRLSERLNVPLRQRNSLLLAAGMAPMYGEHRLDDAALAQARRAVELVLTGHEPYPAVAVDRHWTLVAGNRAVASLLAGAAAELLQPPINVLRLSLHPGGLAPRIENLGEWRAHLLHRLQQQIEATADPVLEHLLDELAGYPAPTDAHDQDAAGYAGVVVPLRLRTEHGTLAFFSTITLFGTPVDITLAELAIESFFPADAATAAALRQLPLPE